MRYFQVVRVSETGAISYTGISIYARDLIQAREILNREYSTEPDFKIFS